MSAVPSSVPSTGLASDAGATTTRPRPLWMRVELWLALAVLALAVPIAVAVRQHRAPRELPRLGHIAAFSLTRESGAPFSSKDVAGKIWVADFVFLGCTESCPMLSTRMSHLQRTIVDEETKTSATLPVRLVSFTVDPLNDTPDRLSAYATHWHADPSRWVFATGTTADIQHVVAEGFKVGYGKVDDGAGAFEIMHGNWLVLVDAEGTIRGYYSSDHPEEMTQLTGDILTLSAAVKS